LQSNGGNFSYLSSTKGAREALFEHLGQLLVLHPGRIIHNHGLDHGAVEHPVSRIRATILSKKKKSTRVFSGGRRGEADPGGSHASGHAGDKGEQE